MDNSQDNLNTPKSGSGLGTLERRIEEATKKQAGLEKIRQLKARKAQVEARAKAEEVKRKRSEENQRKYEIGGLVKLAGLLGADKGALLGGLLMVADRLNSSPDWAAQVKTRGDALLAEREHGRKANSNQQKTQDKEQQP